MKFIISITLCYFSLISTACLAQESIIYITPEQIVENIKKHPDRSTVVQFWVPNCAKAAEIVTHYNELENNYPSGVDFYFVGITNKKELVDALLKKTDFKHTIYIADPSVNNDLIERKESFSVKLCKLLKIKEMDFNTMYIDKKGKVTYYGEEIDIEKDKLKKVML